MNRKVGDKAIVREDIKNVSAPYGISPSMCKLAGKEVTISYACDQIYHVAECEHVLWTDEMFEELNVHKQHDLNKIYDALIIIKEFCNSHDKCVKCPLNLCDAEPKCGLHCGLHVGSKSINDPAEQKPFKFFN